MNQDVQSGIYIHFMMCIVRFAAVKTIGYAKNGISGFPRLKPWVMQR